MPAGDALLSTKLLPCKQSMQQHEELSDEGLSGLLV